MGFQQSLLVTKDENDLAHKNYIENGILPVSNLQERFVGTPTLSGREYEIMQMTLSGLEISDIAIKINLSMAGVKWRLSQVYWKFNAENRLQLINRASKEGLHFFIMEKDKASGQMFPVKHSFSVNVEMMGHKKTNE